MGIRGKSEALQDLQANLISTVQAMEKVKLLGLGNDLPPDFVWSKRVVRNIDRVWQRFEPSRYNSSSYCSYSLLLVLRMSVVG